MKQAGSFVGPDRLRFDFSHFEAVTPRRARPRSRRSRTREIITDAPVRHYETTKEHAESIGAIAFFGDKYGDLVRVLEAGEHSIELCGGTHVHALGFIGPIKIVSEGSIGANLRRIEAVTGEGALDRIHDEEVALRGLADALKVSAGEVPERVERLLAAGQGSSATRSPRRARREAIARGGRRSRPAAADGVVVVRRDGLAPDDLRRLAHRRRATRSGSRRRRARRRRRRRRQGRARGRGEQGPGRGRGVGGRARARRGEGARRRHGQERRRRAGRRPERRRGRRRARRSLRGSAVRAAADAARA